MEQAVALMAGINFLVLGLSYYSNPGDWIAWIAHLQKQERRESLTIGMIHVLVGSFILSFHQVWSGIGLLLSLLGVAACTVGTVYMLLPHLLPNLLRYLEPHCRIVLLYASMIMVSIGLTAVAEWWQYAL